LAAGGDAGGEPVVAAKRVRYRRVPPRGQVVVFDRGILAQQPFNQVAGVVEHEDDRLEPAAPKFARLDSSCGEAERHAERLIGAPGPSGASRLIAPRRYRLTA